jgi:Glycosyltransferase family 87
MTTGTRPDRAATARGPGHPAAIARRMSRFGGIQVLALWAVWLATRAVLYLLTTASGGDGDVGIYQWWYACCLSHGSVPAADPMWQYPPGAALAIWLPGRLAGSYPDSFVLLAIGCDLAITVMLCGLARRGGSLAGAWYWVCGVPLLGTVTLARFDVLAVALSVAALCVAGRGGARGALIGAGAAVKVWPVTLLAGAPPGQGRRTLAAAVAVPATVCALFAGATVGFLGHQAARGAEIESVAATPVMIWRLAGWPGTVMYQFGSYQLTGQDAGVVVDASRLGLVLLAAAVLGWRLLIAAGRVRWRPEFAADAPLAATLLFLVASPVLSPQYLLWVTGLAAACLASGRTTQRPAAMAVLAAAGLTQLIFPIGWHSLIYGSAAVTGVLAARNLLLVVAGVVSCQRILTASSSGDLELTQPARLSLFSQQGERAHLRARPRAEGRAG